MMKRILTYLGIFGASIVGIALVLNFVMVIIVGGRQVDVPDVRGLSEKDAEETLRRSGLKCERLGADYADDYPESTVFIQDPQAGRTVKQGRKVFITLSKGEELREVPYCEGRSLRAATMFLERAGFVTGCVASVSKPGSYPDEVLATDPAAGSQTVRGSVVNILVSTGEPKTKYVLPDLRGKYYLETRFQIERMGVVVSESGSERDLVSFTSVITMQQPPPGFIVARGDTVRVSVSSRYDGGVEL